MRILVVDDETLVSSVFKLLLESDGHSVSTAARGQEALALFRPGNFDIIVTDLLMPGMKGDELAAAIKEFAPMTPVILITGNNETMPSQPHRLKHVDYLLGKPVSIEELREAIRSVSAAARPSSTDLVLMVDDDEDDMFLFRSAVRKRRLPWSIQTVSSIDSAISTLSAPDHTSRFSAIVVDIHLAGRSAGLELVSWVRQQPRFAALPVLVLSGSADTEDRARSLALGATCFMQKSADMSAVVMAILQCLAAAGWSTGQQTHCCAT